MAWQYDGVNVGTPYQKLLPLRIYGIFDVTDYTRIRTPIQTNDNQHLVVDVGSIYPRNQVLPLIENSTLIPKITQQNQLYQWLYCKRLEITQQKDAPNLWDVKVGWESLTNVQDLQLDPTKRAALISRGTWKQQTTPDVDFNGVPVATTAGEPINYTYQQGFPMYTIEKNLPAFPTWCGRANDFVNVDSVTFLGINFAPYELFMTDIDVGHQVYENNVSFYPCRFMLYANTGPNGWKTRLRNAGYHERTFLGFYTKKGQKLAIPGGQLLEPQTKADLTRTLGGVTYYARYGLTPIKLGNPGNYQYPSSPVLIDPNGKAFRMAMPTDPAKGPNTGPVIGMISNDVASVQVGITQKQYANAVLNVSFANQIPFSAYLPLY